MYREVSSFLFFIHIFISRNIVFLDLFEKIQETPHLFIVDLNRDQYFWSTSGFGWCFHTANPSSMYLLMTGRKARSSGVRCSSSKIPRNKLAIAVAGPVPVAIPLCWMANKSPKVTLLFLRTMVKASWIAL